MLLFIVKMTQALISRGKNAFVFYIIKELEMHSQRYNLGTFVCRCHLKWDLPIYAMTVKQFCVQLNCTNTFSGHVVWPPHKTSGFSKDISIQGFYGFTVSSEDDFNLPWTNSWGFRSFAVIDWINSASGDKKLR